MTENEIMAEVMRARPATTTFTWSDKLGARDRTSYLLLVREGKLYRFKDDSGIPGIAAVVRSDRTKNGKWSHTTFKLALGAGVRAIPFRQGWETGSLLEGLRKALQVEIRRWSDLANALGVSVVEARTFFAAMSKRGEELVRQLDEVDAALAALDDAAPEGPAPAVIR